MPHEPSGNHDTLAAGPAPRELPPVEPPTAGFILQLFIIPAVIVAVLIVVVALFGKLAESRRDATEYVQSIRSDNPNVRWRAAYELASLIHNEPKLSESTQLLSELTALLDTELARPQADPLVAQYLATALGTFSAPPPGEGRDPLASLSRATGPTYPRELRAAAIEALARQAARLQAEGGLADPGAISALARSAQDEDPELRQRAAFALGFCRGVEAEAELRRIVGSDADRYTRFNAANALARRGDEASTSTLREMLRTDDLAQIVAGATSSETQARIETIQLQALEALEAAIHGGNSRLAEALRPEVEALARSDLAGVRLRAQSILKNLH